jgi:hypothetical protein
MYDAPKRPLLLALFALLLFAPATASAETERREAENEDDEDLMDRARREKRNPLQMFYKSIRGGKLKREAAVRIGKIDLDLPYAQATLDGGWLIPVEAKEIKEEDLEGKDVPERQTIAAVYLGSGSFHWDSPNEPERWMLNEGLRKVHPTRKKVDVGSLDVAIEGGAVVLFDGSWRERFAATDKGGGIDSKSFRKAERMWKARKGIYFSSVSRSVTQSVFAGDDEGLLLLDMATKSIKGGSYLTYALDPLYVEAVSLVIVRPYALNKDSYDVFDLGKWVLPEMEEKLDPVELAMLRLSSPVDIEHYDLDMTVYRDQDLGLYGVRLEGTTNINILTDDLSMVRLALTNKSYENDQEYRVKVVKDGAGNRLDYLHSGGSLLVRLAEPAKRGDKLELYLQAEGAVVNGIKQPPPATSLTDQQSLGNVVKLVNYRIPVIGLYPASEHLSDYFTFDWILRLPKPMVAATSGTLLSMVEEDGLNVHTIKEQVPVTFPAIIFGRFSVAENDPDYEKGEVKIRIYTHPGQGKDAQSFIDEAEGILKYYGHLFGRPYPFVELDLAQMPVGIGYAQAPAGLVQMTGEVYISKTDLVNIYGVSEPQLRDYFIPHELAHEWWGAQTGHSERDQWVSETFAEFSAALYVEFRDQQKSGDPTDTSGYTRRMQEWKTRRRGHKQDRTAPLWLGGRSGRWTSTAYARGPLIMDLLRQNFGRENVIKAMRYYVNFAQDHRGGFALTEDWQNMLEQAIPGVGFHEFLQKYIKGNAPIPGKGTVTIGEGTAQKVDDVEGK